MTRTVAPQRQILPAPQRSIWPRLAPAARLGFVLYGGTAIALRCGHRASVDFDFFCGRALDRAALASALPLTCDARVLQEAPNTLTLLVRTDLPDVGEVKVSFFGLPGFGRIGQPDHTDDGVLVVASRDDLLATKLKTIPQRAEAKDYRDVAALVRSGADLAHALGGARTLFGPNFQPAEALKALVYFEDGDLSTLTAEDRACLVTRATAVGRVPEVPLAASTPN